MPQPALRAFSRAAALTVALAIVLGALPAAARADLFVTPTGSDANPCAFISPCGSFDRAYHAAAPGTIVQVGAGSYGEQSVTYDAAKTSSARVTFQPAPGASVGLGGLNLLSASHIVVQNINTGFVDVQPGNGGQAMTDAVVVNGGGPGLFIGRSTSNIAIVGGSYGNGPHNVSPVKIQGSPPPTSITLDGVIFHDAIRDSGSSAHLECIYAADVQGLTIRNSQFRNCAIFDLFLTNLDGLDVKNLLLENNFFDSAGSHGGANSFGYYSISISPNLKTATNYLIRYNSLYQGIDYAAGSFNNVVVTANVGPLRTCPSGPVFSYNVWQGKACSATDRTAPLSFVDPRNYDLHLLPGAAAIDRGNPSSFPATDIDGQPRPQGPLPDAGADEFFVPKPPGGGGPAVRRGLLIGTSTRFRHVERLSAGRGKAFACRVQQSGSVDRLGIYLDGRSRARRVTIGLYADRNGHPGAPLGQGSTRARAGRWNTVSVRSTSVRAGAPCWLAVLGTGGELRFRAGRRSGHSELSSRTGLRSLPQRWRRSRTLRNGPVSAYAGGVLSG